MSYQVLSASSAERADKCPGSFALDYEQSEPGFFAVRGTLVHTYLEKYHADPMDAEMFLCQQRSDYNRCILGAIDPKGILDELNSIVEANSN